MKAIKIFSAISIFIASSFANALIVEGDFTARVAYEDSDVGLWSKDLRDSKVTGKFWFDTDYGPTPQTGFPNNPSAILYESETNSWINLILFIDGKTIDLSTAAGPTHNLTPQFESLAIGPTIDAFRIYKTVTTRDPSGGIQTAGVGLWFSSTDDYNELFFSLNKIINEEEQFRSYMELEIPGDSISVRKVSVPEPSSLVMMLIGMCALAFRYRYKKLHTTVKV
jgi:hypothetical protein